MLITIINPPVVRAQYRSYVFSATVIKKSKNFQFTENEAEQGFTLKWYPLDQVLPLFSQDAPKDYHGKFISVRDKAIITHAIKKVNKNRL